MIAVDSSTLLAFLAGDEGRDVDWLDQALVLKQAVLPPVVLTEVLSAPELDRETADLVRDLPVLDIRSGFWERAAETRGRILSKRLRARLADTLIAQTCIDHHVPLVTRDRDFRHFSAHDAVIPLAGDGLQKRSGMSAKTPARPFRLYD